MIPLAASNPVVFVDADGPLKNVDTGDLTEINVIGVG